MTRKYFLSTVLILFSFSVRYVSAQQKIKVGCIGNSITYGYGLKHTQEPIWEMKRAYGKHIFYRFKIRENENFE